MSIFLPPFFNVKLSSNEVLVFSHGKVMNGLGSNVKIVTVVTVVAIVTVVTVVTAIMVVTVGKEKQNY